MGINMKRGTKTFETMLMVATTIGGIALMTHHYFTFN
jgi:hypothetical protein